MDSQTQLNDLYMFSTTIRFITSIRAYTRFPVLFLVLVLIALTETLPCSETPVLSSKAVRTAMSAKKAIVGHDETAIRPAIQSLEELLHGASFRRLESQTQVEILFLLSKGYGRLGLYKEQETLLESSAKKLELHRFHTRLRTALAHSFVQQHRFSEAEVILNKIVSSSCAHMALEEKSEIATLLIYKDEYINALLKQADRLAETGNFSESLQIYETAFPTVDKARHLFQASISDKRIFRQKVLLRIAELSFCDGHYEKVIETLHSWDDDLCFLPENQALTVRRFFLLCMAYHALGNSDQTQTYWQKYLSASSKSETSFPGIRSDDLPTKNTSTQELLWKAQNALKTGSAKDLTVLSELLRRQKKANGPIVHTLKACISAINHNPSSAIEEATLALKESSSSVSRPWKTATVHVLAECSFQRALLLASSHQTKAAEKVIADVVPILITDQNPHIRLRIGAFRLLLFAITSDPSQKKLLQELLSSTPSPQSEDLPLYTLLQRSISPAESGPLLLPLAPHDLFFSSWLKQLGLLSFDSDIEETPTTQEPSDLFSQYSNAVTLFQRALDDDVSADTTISKIQELANEPGLVDVRPQLLHCLVDLFIHTNKIEEACRYTKELIDNYPSYAPLPQAALSCFFACESIPADHNNGAVISQYILSRQQPDIYTLTLALTLHETRLSTKLSRPTVKGNDQGYEKEQIETSSLSNEESAITQFDAALQARDEGRTFLLEAEKSKEPNVITERIRSSMKAFDIARTKVLSCLTNFHDIDSQSFLWGLIFSVETEQIEALERYLPTDSAFNELPTFLDETSSRLKKDLDNFQASLPNHRITKPYLSGCQTLAQTGLMYAQIFRRELDLALLNAKELTDLSSQPALRALIYLSKILRESNRASEALSLLTPLHEKRMSNGGDLPLEIAMEKSLCFREIRKPDKSMALLAWVINGSYASSLRVKAMILRADLYLSLHRKDLAIRQLESVSAKGGEWGAVADRKLKELYGIN